MAKEKLGYAIIGCGTIGPTHAEAFQSTTGAELVAVCDVVEDRAKELAAKYNVPNVYTDYQKMIERDDIDIVSICTPSGMHADMGIACAQAGKNILTEKPMDIRLDKIDALIAATKEYNVKLAGVFQRRTYPVNIKIREMVQSGQLGKMVLGDCYQKYYRDQAYYDSGDWRATWELDGGGSLMNQGVHGIDLIQWIMGGRPKSVYAKANHLVRNIPVEDTAVVVVEWANGAYGVLEGTTSVYPGYNCSLSLHGEHGTIMTEETNILAWNIEGKGDEIPTFEENTSAGGAKDPKAITSIGHTFLVQDIINAVKENRDPYVPGSEARNAVEIILAVYESARTGQPVDLPLQVPTARF